MTTYHYYTHGGDQNRCFIQFDAPPRQVELLTIWSRTPSGALFQIIGYGVAFFIDYLGTPLTVGIKVKSLCVADRLSHRIKRQSSILIKNATVLQHIPKSE